MTHKLICLLSKKDDYSNFMLKNGICFLLDYIFRNNTKKFFFVDDISQSYFVKNKFDVVFFCDTDFFQNGFHEKLNFIKIKNILNSLNKTKKVFLSLGSFVHEKEKSHVLKTKKEIDAIRSLFFKNFVFCCDETSEQILKNAGIFSFLMPCASYFYNGIANKVKLPKQDVTLLWSDPKFFKDDKSFFDVYYLRNFNKLNQYFSKTYNAKVYCFENEEINSAKKCGINKPTILNSFAELESVLHKSTVVVSGNFKYLVPAIQQKCKVGNITLGIKSNFITTFGCTNIKKIDDFSKIKNTNLDLNLFIEKYKNLFYELGIVSNLQENKIPCL